MIRLKNVSKVYGYGENRLYAVNRVSLEIAKGEFLMIMGRSGCGKSTLLNILGCIDTFDEGEYFFFGTDIRSLTPNKLAKLRRDTIGYIYQSYNLIDELNCLNNVELVQGYAGISSKERRKNAQELLKRVGLMEKAKAYPQQLSGGQQQRVAIARAISNRPALLLADEPTGNLDSGTGIQVMELLRRLNHEGITIVMVTHDKELTSYATRVIHMSDGRLL